MLVLEEAQQLHHQTHLRILMLVLELELKLHRQSHHRSH
jgi:hypothetical protein